MIRVALRGLFGRKLRTALTAFAIVLGVAMMSGTYILTDTIDKAWIDEVVGKVGLNDRRTHRPSELSGGQQQRVAVARALVSRPSVMFADEPTGNLDSTTSGEILELMRESVDSYGQTTVMVTHEARAAAIADRVLFLADGLIVKELGRCDPHDVLAAMEEVSRL